VLVQHQIGLVVFLAVLLLIALSNLRAMRRLDEYACPPLFPRFSTLVPARNEEANIGPCVLSLLAQQYPDFQVIVLDDESSDETWQVLVTLAAEDSRLRVLRGKPLPDGWVGKSWACHQLAQAADGELLLFTDADTRHHPQTLLNAAAALIAEEADLVTALPKQDVISWAERLVIPVLPWSILSFLPLGLAYRLRTRFLSAAIGQFMIFRRDAYEQIGGHAAVRQHAVDDVALGRRIKAHGLRWRLVYGGSRIRCRMYESLRQVYEGLTKNLFGIFENNVPVFLFIWLWLAVVFLEPLVVLAMAATGATMSDFSLGLAAAAVDLSLFLWGVSTWRFGFPLYLVFLYPLTIFLVVTIALSSMVLTISGRSTWKGRRLIKQKIRWW